MVASQLKHVATARGLCAKQPDQFCELLKRERAKIMIKPSVRPSIRSNGRARAMVDAGYYKGNSYKARSVIQEIGIV